MLSPLKNIFWMTLHTASALAATIILNLHIADTLTEDTTSILKHLQTTAALYYQEQSTEAIRTYGYQPTTLWEATVQDAIDTATQLTHQPHLIVLTIALAAQDSASPSQAQDTTKSGPLEYQGKDAASLSPPPHPTTDPSSTAS